jgi:acyl carrier protein
MTFDNASYIGEARRLLAAVLDTPELALQIGERAEFLDAGVNSGEIIRLLLECEEYLHVEIEDAELFAVTSLHELAALLSRHQAGADHVV